MKETLCSVILTSVLTFGAGDLRAQCPDDRPVRLSMGIGQFHCAAGWCKIYGAWADGSPGNNQRNTGAQAPDWDFSIEPRLSGIDPNGPAAGKIREGDVLVAVNGRSIVSQFASRVLDSTEPGDTIILTIRRGEDLHDVEIATAGSCRAPAVAAGRYDGTPGVADELRRLVAANIRARDSSRDRALVVNQFDRSAGMGRLGLALACYDCVPEGRIPAWQFRTPPVVVAVVAGGPADRAGIVPGDIVIAYDAIPVTDPEAALLLARIADGETMRLKLSRGGRELSVELTATDPGD